MNKKIKKARNGNPLEGRDGRYCNLKSEECRKHGKVYSDNDGYICQYCGGRVSKWLPLAIVINNNKFPDN